MCLSHIFDISSFFIAAKSFDLEGADASKLWDSIELSTFPLDTRQSLSENLVSIRQTEHSKKLLEEIIWRNFNTVRKLAYGQIGRIVMIILGSGKPKLDLCKKIMGQLSYNNPWKRFIEILGREYASSNMYEALIDEFHKALRETYYIDLRRNDYISPNCFVYLIERLLIMVPHSQGFFFTTKSSLVEFLISLQSDADPSSSLVMDKKYDPSSIMNSVFDMIQRSLCNRAAMEEWIENSHIDCKYYFPVLMLRFFVILCLLCLNSDLSIDAVLEHLSVPQIRSQLPRKFCEGILRVRHNGISYVDALAGAFKVIGDPLVIVASTEKRPKFVSPDAVFINLRSFSCRNEIMETLFPVERNASTAPLPMRPASKSDIKDRIKLKLGKLGSYLGIVQKHRLDEK
ncbi:hypothetical protein CDL12_11363 [Handroanthus impetiginosus]|uniref:Uncharacterized protein n=1 Tax=Handroanthus impetiginosus TaxID=429701 RepID=A0A2G9HEM0_9LAMI|nr:hypothetical protein CDL12_11363 [Handroanthus impetiginosus]